MTPEQSAAYLAADGTACPYCESPDIEGGPVEIEGGSAWQQCHCLDCNATWNDVYTLATVEAVTEPRDDIERITQNAARHALRFIETGQE